MYSRSAERRSDFQKFFRLPIDVASDRRKLIRNLPGQWPRHIPRSFCDLVCRSFRISGSFTTCSCRRGCQSLPPRLMRESVPAKSADEWTITSSLSASDRTDFWQQKRPSNFTTSRAIRCSHESKYGQPAKQSSRTRMGKGIRGTETVQGARKALPSSADASRRGVQSGHVGHQSAQ